MKPEAFWDRVDASGPCWIWTGARSTNGYGNWRGRLVHRLAYELLVGPIPDGLTIDHLCRVRNCVNPDHLDPVTLAVNLSRSPMHWKNGQSNKTHCRHGHPFDETNTRLYQGERICRTCSSERQARYRANKQIGADHAESCV